MIKKFLQKIFKTFSYGFFLKIYGKIEKPIQNIDDHRITTKVVSPNDDLKYKVYKIIDGRLYTDRVHDTAVILDDKIIEGPSFQLRYTHDSKVYNSKAKDNIVLKKGTPRRLKKLKGTVLSLLTGGGGNNNYWHWLYDVLPRFALCSKFIALKEIDYFLLPNHLDNFQNETLNLLNIPKHKRLSSERFRHIKADKLIVTDHPVAITGHASEDMQNIPIWISKWLKESFINQNMNQNNKVKKKIYIDRGDKISNNQLQRKIINEEEIKSYLIKNNFIMARLHDINFIEQVDLFNKAECIVGLHGGGFGNISFCKSGTKVIELRNSTAGPVIENLAKNNQLNYESIIIKPSNNNFPNQQGHIQVPINNLINALKD